MESTVEELSKKYLMAVDVVMNDRASREQRIEANSFCENFKETSPFCVQCGLLLAATNNSPVARNSGFQLMEHCIKYRWNIFTSEEQKFLRDNAMKLLSSGTNHVLAENFFIKNAISKIIVEIAKRQWPQEWPSLMNDLTEICQLGETQTELILIIFQRLSEDVVVLQTMSNLRRRELHQALSSNMAGIMTFFMNLLFEHVAKYLSYESVNDKCKDQIQLHRHMIEAVVKTLSAFVDWVPSTHLWARDGMLQMLCMLLTKESIQLNAAECLLQIVNRKGKVEERKPLLQLFEKECMEHIFKAADNASVQPVNEHHYNFLKHLCQLLVGIGGQLIVLWGAENVSWKRENFEIYLNAIFAFTCHSSQVLNSYAQTLWLSFFRHELIAKDSVLESYIHRLAEVARLKIVKVGFPSRNDHSCCAYSCLDFDCDDDFNTFFSRYRNDVIETLRLIANISPITTFQLGAIWLDEHIKKPIVSGTGNEKDGMCNYNSPSFLEWDALSLYLEAVVIKISQPSKLKLPIESGIELLKAVLAYKTTDPLILSATLSCVSALCWFLTSSSEVVPSVLEKLFSAVVFLLPGEEKGTRNRSVKNLRRHACSALVKMGKLFPSLLLPSFHQILYRVNELNSDPDRLSHMEKCMLLEALIIICNSFNNYSDQLNFIETNMASIKTVWCGQEITSAFSSPENLMSYIGLNQNPVPIQDTDTFGNNRSQIIYFISVMSGVVKRSKWPDDIDVAKNGGFIREFSSSSQNAVRCNPATHSILPLLENLLKLIEAFNGLWTPQVRCKVVPEFGKVYDMMDVDKNNILGIQTPWTDPLESTFVKSPADRMQSFLTVAHDLSYHVLASVGPSLSHEFYATSNLGQHIANHMLRNIDFVPDYRLRSVIRIFMKPFVQFCPPEYYNTAIIPILVHLCPYMAQRLYLKWKQIAQKYANGVMDECDGSETQELIEDQLNRQISRDYIDLLGAVLQQRRGPAVEPFTDAMDEDDQFSPPHHSQSESNLSDLGHMVIRNSMLCPSIVKICFSSLSWDDTTICNKAFVLCSSLMKQLVASQMIGSDDAKDLLVYILLGLQQHGQHDGNRSILIILGMQAYDSLRPLHPILAGVMNEIPDCPTDVLKKYDDILLQTTNTIPVVEKKRKEMFKKIVSNIIGVNVGQLFTKPVHMNNLPPLSSRSKPKARHLLDINDTGGAGLCRLFADANETET